MDEQKRRRIKFYTRDDLACGYHLSNIDELLDNFEINSSLTLNDLIEFYNIKLYFENGFYLATWTESEKNLHINTVEQVNTLLKGKIYSLTEDSLEEEVLNLDYNFYGDFWMLLNNLNDCKKISDQTISEILHNSPRQINYILKQKKLVEKYDKTVRSFLINYPKTSEILLSSLEQKDTFGKKDQTYFPKSLTLSDKESILNSYLDTDAPNFNYVRLIENSRDTNEFKLSPKTRLKAKKKSKELNARIFQDGHSWNVGVGVTLCKDQIEPVKINYEGTVLEASYSEPFIDRFTDNTNLFLVFKYLFLYTDDKNLIPFVSKQSELDVLERTSMKSKNEYETGYIYHRKENLSNLQLYIFNHYLRGKGKSVELLINSFVDFINEKLTPHKLAFRLSSNETSYLEKIRILAPDFEFLLKQYKSLVDEKCIDFELLQISSNPVRLSEIQSQKSGKYIYSDNNLILQLKYLFFSDQSHLFYLKHFEDKYHCFYDLIINEDVKLEYFADYQKSTIERLINDDYLKLSDDHYVTLDRDILIYLVGELHKKEVLSYWDYPLSHRKVMDELIDKKLAVTENTLFSRQERNYFNFYLNKKEFTNGYDLRNKYLHGTNTLSEKEHETDYYRLIKLIILTLLKIENDITTD